MTTETELHLAVAENTLQGMTLVAVIGWIFFGLCFCNYMASVTESGIAKQQRDRAVGYLRANGVAIDELMKDAK